MARARGYGGAQWSCLDVLWGDRESGWNETARNSSSGAGGIPQALPASKMGAAAQGSGWRAAIAQIRWGLDYIADRYGSPCGAIAHSNATGWY